MSLRSIHVVFIAASMPAEKHGIRVVSMGFLADSKALIIWRGPMLHGVVRQFFQDVRCGELDYLVIDMPPGAGDVALSLTQTVPVAGAIVVTTPQGVSLADTRLAIAMYHKLEVPSAKSKTCPPICVLTAGARATSSEKVGARWLPQSSTSHSSGTSLPTSPFVSRATPAGRL